MKDDNQADFDSTKADIKLETISVSKLTAAITSAQARIDKINTFMKEATEIRNTGKAENKLAIKDAQDAQKAIANAISVLTTFYKGTGAVKKEDWELLQEDVDAPVKLPKDPALWDSAYTGANSKSKQPAGILAVLKQVGADFAAMEGETRGQEVVDQQEYEKDMQSNKIEKARRSKEAGMKSSEKRGRAGTISSLTTQKKSAESALSKTAKYQSDLKDACVNTGKGDSYSKRNASRNKEIVALKQAQETLKKAFEKKVGFLQIRD